jgi:hypothetical protein
LVTEELNKIDSLDVRVRSHRDRANSLMFGACYVTGQDVDDLETPGMYTIRYGDVRHISAVQALIILKRAFGSDFDLNTGDKKAKFVVLDVLQWRNYRDYVSTMKKF